ncbi:hypothetical protein M758_2G050700, partial [Ceratodon purpureus]
TKILQHSNRRATLQNTTSTTLHPNLPQNLHNNLNPLGSLPRQLHDAIATKQMLNHTTQSPLIASTSRLTHTSRHPLWQNQKKPLATGCNAQLQNHHCRIASTSLQNQRY